MSFISFRDYLFESEQLISGKKGKLESQYGWYDYYYEVSNEYPDGVIVGLGAYVHKEYRDKGKYKEMLKELLSLVPEGTVVQMAPINKYLLTMFKRLGFKKIKSIKYWGEVTHAMENIVTPQLINSI